MSYSQNFATMEKRQTVQPAQSEPKRLEYRSPSVAKLGKLADVTLAVGTDDNPDGAIVGKTKT
jgi:hypothetical protein